MNDESRIVTVFGGAHVPADQRLESVEL